MQILFIRAIKKVAFTCGAKTGQCRREDVRLQANACAPGAETRQSARVQSLVLLANRHILVETAQLQDRLRVCGDPNV